MEKDTLIVNEYDATSDKKWNIKNKIQKFLSNFKCGGSFIPVRYEIAIVTSIGFLISFSLRCNLGASVVAMTHNRTKLSRDGKTVYVEPPEFNWSSEAVGLLDSSFFWGYIVTQIPGGFLSMAYPPNYVFGFALGFSSLLNLLIPSAAKIHYGLVMFLRVTQGLAEGVTYPAAHGIWRWWAPPLERSILSTITFTGSYAGVAVGIPLSGLMTEHFNWQVSFYVFGIVGILWFIYWWYISYERPSVHPTISEEERHYIEENLKQDNTMIGKTWANVPWLSIMTSMPVWAIVVANFCRSWSFYLFIDTQAKYFLEALDYNVGKNWIAAALPHIIMATIVPIGGQIADYLRRHHLSTTLVRKLMNCGGFGVEGIFLLVVAFTNNPIIAIAALSVAVGASGFAISGFNVNHLDIAPRYASVLMGISNGLGTLASIICPIIVGIVTKDGKRSQWSIIFLITGLIHIVGVIFYGIFASGTKQPWADPPHSTNDDEETQLINTSKSISSP